MSYFKFSVGGVNFYGVSHDHPRANEMRKPRQISVGGENYCRFDPSDEDSIIKAAKYVCASPSEITNIKINYKII